MSRTKGVFLTTAVLVAAVAASAVFLSSGPPEAGENTPILWVVPDPADPLRETPFRRADIEAAHGPNLSSFVTPAVLAETPLPNRDELPALVLHVDVLGEVDPAFLRQEFAQGRAIGTIGSNLPTLLGLLGDPLPQDLDGNITGPTELMEWPRENWAVSVVQQGPGCYARTQYPLWVEEQGWWSGMGLVVVMLRDECRASWLRPDMTLGFASEDRDPQEGSHEHEILDVYPNGKQIRSWNNHTRIDDPWQHKDWWRDYTRGGNNTNPWWNSPTMETSSSRFNLGCNSGVRGLMWHTVTISRRWQTGPDLLCT